MIENYADLLGGRLQQGFLLTLVSWKQAHEEPLVFAALTPTSAVAVQQLHQRQAGAVLAVNRATKC